MLRYVIYSKPTILGTEGYYYSNYTVSGNVIGVFDTYTNDVNGLFPANFATEETARLVAENLFCMGCINFKEFEIRKVDITLKRMKVVGLNQ